MRRPVASPVVGLLLVAVLGLSSTAGCGDPPPRRLPTEAADAPSKAELFGSATLVPTRAGEQARAELSLAAELSRVVEAMPRVESAQVAVRLAPPSFARAAPPPTRAVMTVALAPETDAATLRASVQATARTWLGDDAALSLTVVESAPPAPPTEDRPGRAIMIAVTLLGLGASLGVTVDRAFDRRRRSKRGSRVPSPPTRRAS